MSNCFSRYVAVTLPPPHSSLVTVTRRSRYHHVSDKNIVGYNKTILFYSFKCTWYDGTPQLSEHAFKWKSTPTWKVSCFSHFMQMTHLQPHSSNKIPVGTHFISKITGLLYFLQCASNYTFNISLKFTFCLMNNVPGVGCKSCWVLRS